MRMSRSKLLMLSIIVILGSLASYYILQNNVQTNEQVITISLKGAGASFPYPLIQTLIDKYQNLNPNITIDYASVGSGAGQSNIMNKLVDFAGSDAPLKDEQLSAAETWILHIPYTLGAVVLSYNIPGLEHTLNLTPSLIAGIYSGKIIYWNDPKIVEYNPALANVNESIFVVHRSDSSGTTFIFTSFLSRENSMWRDSFGAGKSISWPNLPTFIGGKGNEGVTNLIQQTPYSIGYVEYTYAYKNNLPMAAVMNRNGEFIIPSLESISLSANINVSNLDPKDLRISHLIIDSDAEGAYPISAPTYFLVYIDWSVYGDDESVYLKAKAFKQWVYWILTDGEAYYRELGYAPLPDNLKKVVFEALDLISFQGNPVS